jgi:hypothetical protein
MNSYWYERNLVQPCPTVRLSQDIRGLREPPLPNSQVMSILN